MKLQLDWQCLERMIGGDTEAEIEVKKGIVHEFAKRHLREIAETETYQKAVEEIRQQINKIVKEEYGVDRLTEMGVWPQVESRFRSIIADIVKKTAQETVDAQIQGVVEYQKKYWSREIDKILKTSLHNYFDEAFKKAIEDNAIINNLLGNYIEEAIRKGVQERLEAAAKLS